MPIVCRLIALSSPEGASLTRAPETVTAAVEAARIYSDVYRYWHAIDFLLRRHRPADPYARLLEIGSAIPGAAPGVPPARIVDSGEAARFNATLATIAPEDLAPHYDAEALDAASVYPAHWIEWEESFDPLGQILEHYSFLQYFTARRAEAGEALLLFFEFKHDETDD